eukprot:TRINITY_DN2733_c0_g1_i1.p1 TRINITY_DN2733_c0_g1~~TRINITY_DN2733_c0_g1_i1.p1  ORF type:complete len:278 (-),score=62.80 TRINITY_DN2733_c0_g1_i1:268-1101(-)
MEPPQSVTQTMIVHKGQKGQQGTFRPGDWICAQPGCGNHNYASRVICGRCKNPPAGQAPPLGALAAPLQFAYEQKSALGVSEIRPGDWMCPKFGCGNYNYASRTTCGRCGTPPVPVQSEVAALLVASGTIPVSAFTGSTGGVGGIPGRPAVSAVRPGDWICANCHNHNYARRATCNKCSAPQSAGGTMIGGAGVGGLAGLGALGRVSPYPAVGQQGRPGDWQCNSCQFMNYRSRTECKRCGGKMQPGQGLQDQQLQLQAQQQQMQQIQAQLQMQQNS